MYILKFLFKLKTKFPLTFFIATRFVSMAIILFILGFIVFALMELTPGDIVDNYVKMQLLNSGTPKGMSNSYSQDLVEQMKTQLGLNKPFYMQYFNWLKQVFVERDLGRSLISRAEILPLVSSRMINSLILNLISLFVLTIISFIIGIFLSIKANSKIDVFAGILSLFFHAFPGLLMLLILQFFAASTGWFPIKAYPSGMIFSENPVGFTFSYLHHIFLPLLAAFLGGIGGTIRTIRATMLDQIGKPYIKTLRVRGISEKRIYFAHAFRNTMNPYITSSSNLLASLFSGSLILEIIFSYPGIGKLMYEAVIQQDVNLVLVNIMFISFLVLFGIMVSDILLALVDPRIKYGSK